MIEYFFRIGFVKCKKGGMGFRKSIPWLVWIGINYFATARLNEKF